MKTFSVDSQSYKMMEKWLDNLDAQRITAQLMKIENAGKQMMAIDTMHTIINRSPEKYAAYSHGTSLAAQIRQEQRNKIEQWGEKAYTLSEKQIAVIAREIAELATQKVEA